RLVDGDLVRRVVVAFTVSFRRAEAHIARPHGLGELDIDVSGGTTQAPLADYLPRAGSPRHADSHLDRVEESLRIFVHLEPLQAPYQRCSGVVEADGEGETFVVAQVEKTYVARDGKHVDVIATA